MKRTISDTFDYNVVYVYTIPDVAHQGRLGIIKNTQNATQGVYAFVPLRDFSESWDDAKLYAKYGLTPEEIAFIESMIRAMP
jgi:hypothetical protein